MGSSYFLTLFLFAALRKRLVVFAHPEALDCGTDKLALGQQIMRLDVTNDPSKKLGIRVTDKDGNIVTSYKTNSVLNVKVDNPDGGCCAITSSNSIGKFTVLSENTTSLKCPSLAYTPHNKTDGACYGTSTIDLRWSASDISDNSVTFAVACSKGPGGDQPYVYLETTKVATTPTTPTTTPTTPTSGCDCCDGKICTTTIDAGSNKDFFKVSWTLTDTSIDMGIHIPTKAWIGVGLSKDGKMSGAYAIIGTAPGQSFASGEYTLGGYSKSLIVQENISTVQNLAVVTLESGTSLQFRRSLVIDGSNPNRNFGVDGALSNMIIAAGTSNTFDYHDTYKAAFNLNLRQGKSTAGSAPLSFTVVAFHAFAMLLAMAILLPVGILLPIFKSRCPQTWFKAHMWMQITGFLLLIIAFIVMLAKKISDGSTHFNNQHEILGLVVIILAFLQPVNGFLRPHISKDHGKSLTRSVWEIFHHLVGYACVLLAWVNIIFSFSISMMSSNYSGILVAVKVTFAIAITAIMITAVYLKVVIAKAQSRNDEKDEEIGSSLLGGETS